MTEPHEAYPWRTAAPHGRIPPWRGTLTALAVAACLLPAGAALADDDDEYGISPSQLSITKAIYRGRRDRLKVSGEGTPQATVTLVNAYDASQVLGDDDVSRTKGIWSVRAEHPDPVPCRVRAIQDDGQTAESDVKNAPEDCAPKAPTANLPPTADANGPYTGTVGETISFDSNGSTDPDGGIVSYFWDFGDNATSDRDNPSHAYSAAGTYTVSLTVTDSDGAQGGDSTTATISDPAVNLPPTADAGGPYSGTVGAPVGFDGSGSADSDGSVVAYSWDFGDGNTGSGATPSHTYSAIGSYTVTLTVTDDDDTSGTDTTSASIAEVSACPEPVDPPDVSINSTSQDSVCQSTTLVPEQSIVLNGGYSVVAINDLGMHCGDLDSRIAGILPPFQVLLAQVIEKGREPTLNPAGISVSYSAASNPNDPVLDRNVFDGIKADGSTYKTNFWDAVANGAYDPFYPGGMGITPLETGAFPVTADWGLPVPNVEELYIGADGVVDQDCGLNPANCDGTLTAVQHAMPGLPHPYAANGPREVKEHYGDKPFFVGFPFGYVAEDVNWYEGAGVPFAAFDDFGRENAYPLVRVQAKDAAGGVVATVDTVLPISGEASCTNCHSDPADVQNSRTSAPTDALLNANPPLPVATSLDDPDPDMPIKVSVEYAADINILRLHDLRHGPNYVDTSNMPAPCDIHANDGDGNDNCLTNQALVQHRPVVCQVCHYTPALDLAQVGPQSGAPGTEANGRNQLSHQSNSRVMHNHHGQFEDLFPPMPAPAQLADGTIANQTERLTVLDETCYQCHPGSITKCLRGAMFDGGMLCNDCHGDMKQVGADFSAGVSPDNPGAFILDQGNFYDPHSGQPRVPWANEPGCGSCHTGDANDNLAGTSGTIANTADLNGVTDGIRLRQAFLSGDAKATPIVPANKRFAEPAVPATFSQPGTDFPNPGAGNPQLYRVSTGHGGVFCEGCHGATHAEWSSSDRSNRNDNIAAKQLQEHPGAIIECGTCHITSELPDDTQGGPHGMHLVNDRRFWKEGHKDAAKDENGRPGGGTCGACHGSDHRGTVLSRAPVDRSFYVEGRDRTVQAGEPVGCGLCHSVSKSFER